MNSIEYVIISIAATLLRFLPFACKTGLIKIGNPDRNSPVFITCNYCLTVARVKRALKGIDCYLLVANSRGINVWCASAGGHFTNHSVISVLKTSGIEGFVSHRKVILPQLAGTGVEAQVIRKKTGWKVIWGPVYAKDISFFVENKLKKLTEMREVRFPLSERIEMSIAVSFSISVVLALIVFTFWQEAVLPIILQVWGFSFVIFLCVPLYENWLRFEGRIKSFLGQFGFSMMLWSVVMVGFVAYSEFLGDFSWKFIFRWGLILFIVVFCLSFELRGSTPVFKSGLHGNGLKVVIGESKCRGAGFCEQVCPRNCYDMDKIRHVATMSRENLCIQCGACIVQCPFDALFFREPNGNVVTPETVRRFKLNLLFKRGKRLERGSL